MFGSSSVASSKDDQALEDSKSSTDTKRPPDITIPDDNDPALDTKPEKSPAPPESPAGRKSGEMSPSGERKSRRSSGVAKAKDMFSSAKQAFSSSPTRQVALNAQTPLQKLGKTDPALSVPQGSLNNAAGESNPGPKSTFRVGVTEDKNKKCRRTMEDTHAYLYNFLSTPAPLLEPPSATASKRPSGQSTQSSNLETMSTTSSSSTTTHPIVETDNGYFAIFDGHAGTFAAEWCGKKLHILLEDIIRRNPNKAIPELLDETFTSVDQQLDKLPLKNSGCTAVTAVLRWEDRIPNAQSATGSTSIAPAAAAAIARETSTSSSLEYTESGDSSTLSTEESKQTTEVSSSVNISEVAPAVEAKIREAATRQRVLYTANVGDARIVLCRNGKALRLSYDHKGSDENEGRRIANAGGLILNNRVNGVLAVTRALGDSYMKDLVTGHPYTTETVIQQDLDEFLILACDGLWDVCSDQEAVDLVRQVQDPQAASKLLVDHALARFSTDNLSCMIVRFQNTSSGTSDLRGVEGDPVPEGVSETEAIVSSARRNLEGAISDARLSESASRDSGEQLQRFSTERIVEDAEMEVEAQQAEQEPGPEMDADALAKARQKAAEGKVAAATSDE